MYSVENIVNNFVIYFDPKFCFWRAIMANIKIDLTKTIKNMKPMHGGGQPPSPTKR